MQRPLKGRPVTASPLPVEPLESRTLYSTVPLGGNLNLQTDRFEDHPLVDLVPLTRGFFNAFNQPVPTTSRGWPLADFRFSADDQSEFGKQVTPGTYHMSFVGPANVTVIPLADAPGPRSGPAIAHNTGTVNIVPSGYDATTGTHYERVVVSPGVYTLAFNFTHTGGQVRNIHLIQPGYDPANHPVFTTPYVNLLRHLGPNVLRFMDFTQTNSNPDVNWSDRTQPANDARAATNGIPWEDVILLANTLHVGVWINVPAMATDDYVRNLATLVKNTLAPGLPVYVEYSNEVWNYYFDQGTYNKNVAVAEVKANPNSDLNYDHLSDTSGNEGLWAERRYARRSVQIANIFHAIDPPTHVVLGGQASYLGRFNIALDYVARFYGAPSRYFYSLGIAPYVEMNKYADQYGAKGITADQVLQGFSLSIDHYQSTNAIGRAAALARSYGLKLDAYEAGEDTFGPANTAAKAAAARDPRNEAIVERFLHLWYSSGGDQLNWYTLGARTEITQYGTWSITFDINDYNQPKELAFIKVRNGG